MGLTKEDKLFFDWGLAWPTSFFMGSKFIVHKKDIPTIACDLQLRYNSPGKREVTFGE
jgi:hypothetical protein